MRFIFLSKRSLGLVLFWFKRVSIITPLIVSIDVLLTINMSKTNTSTRIYTLDISICKDRVLFSCKNQYLGYNETSAITRTFARSRLSRYSRVPLYYNIWCNLHFFKSKYITITNVKLPIRLSFFRYFYFCTFNVFNCL